MFRNPAKSIQSFAIFVFIFGVLIGGGITMYGIGNLKDNSGVSFIIEGVIIIFGSIITSMFMQAFGLLCEKVNKIFDEAEKTNALVYNMYTIMYNQQNYNGVYDNSSYNDSEEQL